MSWSPMNQSGQLEPERQQPQIKPRRFINSFVSGYLVKFMPMSVPRQEFSMEVQLRILTMRHLLGKRILMVF
jgi:hypothetical protein